MIVGEWYEVCSFADTDYEYRCEHLKFPCGCIMERFTPFDSEPQDAILEGQSTAYGWELLEACSPVHDMVRVSMFGTPEYN